MSNDFGSSAPAPPPDFAAVLALLALVTDASATKERLAALASVTAAAAKAQADLATVRAEHERLVTETWAEIEAEKTRLAERWASLQAEVGGFENTREYFREQSARYRGQVTEELAGGLTRTWSSPEARARDELQNTDPHFRVVADPTFKADHTETITEKVEHASPSTLTRSRPARNRRDAHG